MCIRDRGRVSLKTPPRSFTSTLSGLRAPSLTIGDSAPRVAAPIEYVEWLVDGRDSDASRNMSREPGREGTEASEAWREAGRDMVMCGGRRGGVEIVVGSWLPLCPVGGVSRPGAASVVVRRFRAAEGQPRLDAVLFSSGVSQSKLERRYVSSMSDMLGSSHFSFWTGFARAKR